MPFTLPPFTGICLDKNTNSWKTIISDLFDKNCSLLWLMCLQSYLELIERCVKAVVSKMRNWLWESSFTLWRGKVCCLCTSKERENITPCLLQRWSTKWVEEINNALYLSPLRRRKHILFLTSLVKCAVMVPCSCSQIFHPHKLLERVFKELGDEITIGKIICEENSLSLGAQRSERWENK